MRKSKMITIVDGENSYQFRLTQVSARAQGKWLIRAGIMLTHAGLLDIDVKDLMTSGDLALDRVAGAILNKGFSFIGRLDADELEDLFIDLVSLTAVRVTKNEMINIDKQAIDELFNDLGALWQLFKEVLTLNFMKYLPGKKEIENSDLQPQSTNPHISIRATSPQA